MTRFLGPCIALAIVAAGTAVTAERACAAESTTPGSAPTAARAAAAPSMEAARSTPIVTDVLKMAFSVTRDLSTEGPLAWLRYFEDDARFLMVTDGRVQFDGIDSARSFLLGFAKTVSHMELAWSDMRIEALGPGRASLNAAYRETITDTQGKTRRLAGYFTGVAVETPAGWRLRTVHWSSPPPS